MENINIKKVIKNLENSLLKCDKAIEYWEKQSSQEIEDEYKKECLSMIENQKEQKEAIKQLINKFKKDYGTISNTRTSNARK